MKAFLSPLKGESTNSENYPHRIDMRKLSSGGFMDYEVRPEIVQAIHEAEGDVGTLFMVRDGEVIFQMAFSDANDAMMFKLRFFQ